MIIMASKARRSKKGATVHMDGDPYSNAANRMAVCFPIS